MWAFFRFKLQFSKAALIEDCYGCSVFHGLANIVSVNGFSKNCWCATICLLNGCTREPDERGVWQSIPEVFGVAVLEGVCVKVLRNFQPKPVLATVCFVSYYYDISSIREQRVLCSGFGEELLYGREYYAA